MKTLYIPMIWILLLFSYSSAENSYSIIVNKELTMETIDKETASSIYLGKKSNWPNGSRIHVVILDQDEINKLFMNDIIKKTPTQYKAYWNQLVFTGKGTPPISFKTSKEVVEYVKTNSGAIGFIESNQKSGDVKEIMLK